MAHPIDSTAPDIVTLTGDQVMPTCDEIKKARGN